MTARIAAAEPDAGTDGRPVHLEVIGLGKRYGEQAAPAQVSFCVHEAEFLAVLGPSGAGKTTLLRCISGLTTPDTGVVRLGDADFVRTRSRERRQIAVVFQQCHNQIGCAPEIKKRLAAEGSEPVGSTPAEFTAHLRSEIEQWTRVIKQAGIRGG